MPPPLAHPQPILWLKPPAHSFLETTLDTALVALSAFCITSIAIFSIMAFTLAYRLRRGADAIDITSDEESEDDLKPKAKTRGRPTTPIDLNEDGDEEVVDLTGDDNDAFNRELTPNELKRIQANKNQKGKVLEGHRLINKATSHLGVVVVSSTEDESCNAEFADGDFMRVLHIHKHLFTQEVYITGVGLRRTRRVDGYFKKNCNELCAILQQTDDVEDPALDSSLVTRPLAEVIRTRKIIFTNQEFPRLSFRTDGDFYAKFKYNPSLQEIQDYGVLVCRSKHIECCSAANGKVGMDVILGLSESEADKGKGVSNVVKKYRWLERDFRGKDTEASKPEGVREMPERTPTSRRESREPIKVELAPVIDLTGGLNSEKKRSRNTIDLTSMDSDDEGEEITTKIHKTSIMDSFKQRGRNSFERRRSVTLTSYTSVKKRGPSMFSSGTFGRPSPDVEYLEPYTYGDICAGAGGMAEGATLAGLDINFLLDHWDVACDTLRRNWRNAKVLEASIFSFCVEIEFNIFMRVDILHISFPCQPNSLAHTRPGKDDEANEAAAMSVLNILDKCRPRVVTFEQTWSILCPRRRPHFEMLISQLTVLGFNVRWKVFNCAEYGNVQPRKRLFIVASCPGEPLPPFPKPTHGPVPGRKPFVTIKDRLALVPAHVEPHMYQHTLKNAAPYNPNTILRKAITCDGGEGDIHPSGRRSFNMQELASLGGFPASHKFTGCKTHIRKQIGNAVPSMVGQKIFEEIQKSMREVDKRERNLAPEVVEEIRRALAGRDEASAIVVD